MSNIKTGRIYNTGTLTGNFDLSEVNCLDGALCFLFQVLEKWNPRMLNPTLEENTPHVAPDGRQNSTY